MNFWPSCGFDQLQRNGRGWLIPTDDYWRLWLARPELALVDESCPDEIALHQSLQACPTRTTAPSELAALSDADVRDNYQHFFDFREGLRQAGTLEAYYLGLIRSGTINIAPLFIDLLAQAIVRNVLNNCNDAFEVRAAEMLFRSQRISIQDGQVLSGDRDVLDLLNDTGGMGALGRLLIESKVPVRELNLEVLNLDNAASYWHSAERHTFLLDLTHEVNHDLSHGLSFTLTRARSGLKALSRVLEQWIEHFLGVKVSIQPEQKIDDPNWRWHLGLDAESSALLNDLYQDLPVSDERMRRLISLFRLEFKNPDEMRSDVAGKPVYLGLTMNADNCIKLKPQNLLLNLPLSSTM